MRTILLALAMLSAHTFSSANTLPSSGSQDSTDLGGASSGLGAYQRTVFTQTSSSSCPAGYNGEIMYSRSVVGGVGGPWSETYRNCTEAFYTVPETATRTLSCLSGYTGSITQTKTDIISVSQLTGRRIVASSTGWVDSANSCTPIPPAPTNGTLTFTYDGTAVCMGSTAGGGGTEIMVPTHDSAQLPYTISGGVARMTDGNYQGVAVQGGVVLAPSMQGGRYPFSYSFSGQLGGVNYPISVRSYDPCGGGI